MEEQLDYTITLLEDHSLRTLDQKEDGCKYKIDVVVPMSYGWLDNMYWCVQSDIFNYCFKIPFDHNDEKNVHFSGEVFLESRAVYRTFFTLTCNGRRFYLNKNRQITDFLDNNAIDKISVNFDTPEWAKGAVMYHIFVDRFKHGNKYRLRPMKNRIIRSWDEGAKDGPNEDGNWSNDFFGGDLEGIIQKLNYIKSLGTDIIYLSPVVKSQSNHRYDAADYENVDPYAGTNEDLKRLCDEAHKRGMRVVLDAVFNHTGNDSKYFNEYGNFKTTGATQDKESYYGSFFKKHYGEDGRVYFDHWWGMPNLPVCDGCSKNWQDYIYGENGVIDQWFALGIDGLRLDVADELTDEFIEGIRRAVKRNKEDGFIIGEVWKNAMRMNRSYLSSGKGMDSHMDYPLVDALMRYLKYSDVTKLRYIIQDMLNEYPKATIDTMMNFTSTHDISRPIDIFGSKEFDFYTEWAWDTLRRRENENDFMWFNNFELTKEEYAKGKELFKTYLFCLNFMPGILSIFYGDEVGIEGLGNILNRQPFPWGHEDRELLQFVRTMGQIRKNEQFLKQADMKIVDINNDYFMFERMSNNGDALVTINRTPDEKKILIPSKYEHSDKVYRLKKSSKTILSSYGGNAIIKY